jgi:hypothetical protein
MANHKTASPARAKEDRSAASEPKRSAAVHNGNSHSRMEPALAGAAKCRGETPLEDGFKDS